MLTLPRAGDARLDPVRQVVTSMLEVAPALRPGDLMIVGAACRDLLHSGLGHSFATHGTSDLDLAVALSAWDDYRQLAAAYSPIGSNQIRYRIAGIAVDLLAFGDVEDPPGSVTPPPRDQAMSVWAFREIFEASTPLDVAAGITIRIPTIAGYAAAKLNAWLNRSPEGDDRDARDIGLCLHWYAEFDDVHDRLYGTSAGQRVLIAEEMDVPRSAARLLAIDLTTLLGATLTSELLSRWPGEEDLLLGHLADNTNIRWPMKRRVELLGAFTRGLTGPVI